MNFSFDKNVRGNKHNHKKWEWYFQKLQYGQSLDENNQNAREIFENENRNQIIKQNDVDLWQNKSYNKYNSRNYNGSWEPTEIRNYDNDN